MARMNDAAIWIGETFQLKRLKVYVVGNRPNGDVSVWIEAGAGARRPPLPGFAHQGVGFDSIEIASAFAAVIFDSQSKFDNFLSFNLNPLSLKIESAPRLVQQVVPWARLVADS